MFLKIIGIIFIILVIVIWPILASITPDINDNYFKLIKIKKFSFMFRGVDFESAKKNGIIKALFILQIIGYSLAFISAILVLIFMLTIKFPINLNVSLAVLGVIWFCEAVATSITIIILSKISKKRSSEPNREENTRVL